MFDFKFLFYLINWDQLSISINSFIHSEYVFICKTNNKFVSRHQAPDMQKTHQVPGTRYCFLWNKDCCQLLYVFVCVGWRYDTTVVSQRKECCYVSSVKYTNSRPSFSRHAIWWNDNAGFLQVAQAHIYLLIWMSPRNLQVAPEKCL